MRLAINLLFFLLTGITAAKAGTTLTLQLEGVSPNEKGLVRVYLYRSVTEWEQDRSVEVATLSPQYFLKPVTLATLPPGTYALTAYHDKNNNGEHDRNLLGRPKEKFAISNVRQTLWSSPRWNEIKFELKDGGSRELRLLFKMQ